MAATTPRRAAGPDLLKLLANRTNRDILTLLKAEPTYARRIGELVGITEGEAQKRLRQMEELGLVEGKWVHVGKNVKRYTLQADALRLEVGPDGLRIHVETDDVTAGAGAGADGAPSGTGARSRSAGARAAAPPLYLPPPEEEVPSVHGLVGREAEMRAVEAAFTRQAAVAVLGIAGIGKTSLAARVARAQGQDGKARAVFWTTLRGSEGAPQLLSRLAVFLGARGEEALVASLLHLDAADDLNPRIALVAQGLGRLGALVVVDDVHRAGDEGLRAVLGALAERAGLEGFRVLFTGRTLPRGLPRAALALVDLTGLDAADTAALLQARGLDASPEEAAQVQARTGGHALALGLLAEAAKGRGVGAGELAALLPATRIEAYLWEEVFGDLAPEDRAFLARLAVVRGPVDLELAEAVTGDGRARERIFLLERRHLCMPAGEGWVLHDVVRTFAQRLRKGQEEAHAAAARVLEARGGVAEALEALRHALEAGKGAEGRAMALVRREFESRAYRFVEMGLAVGYQAALRRLAPSVRSEDRVVVLLEDAACRLVLGPAPDAAPPLEEAEAILQAGKGLPPLLGLRHRFLIGLALNRAGLAEDAAETFAGVAEEALAAGQEELHDDAVYEQAYALEDADRIPEAVTVYRRALARARQAQDLRRTALIEGGLARALLHQGAQFRAQARQHLDAGLAAARESGDLRAEANLQRTLADYLIDAEEVEEALRQSQAYLHTARRLGDPWSINCAVMAVATATLENGDYDAARRWTGTLLEANRKVPLPFFVHHAGTLEMFLAAHEGDWARFEHLLDAFLEGTGPVDHLYRSFASRELRRLLDQGDAGVVRPLVERVLAKGPVTPWIREPMAAYLAADGQAPASSS